MYLLTRIELWRSAAGWMIGLAEKGGGSIAMIRHSSRERKTLKANDFLFN